MHDIAVLGSIQLGAFLKLAGAVGTGGEGKHLVQSGAVTVNGALETRRGHRLSDGDVVAVAGQEYRVCASPS